MRKMLSVFFRDLKIASEDPMLLYIFVAPFIIAFIINAISPGIQESTVDIVVDSSVDAEYIKTLEDYVNLKVVDTYEDLEDVVKQRNEFIGVTNINDEYTLILEGNELESSVEIAKYILSLNNLNAFDNLDTSALKVNSFNEQIPFIKLMISIGLLLLITIMVSMVIAFGLVDEKVDKSINSASVTPMSINKYILSKSFIGILSLIISSFGVVLILGLTSINFLQLFVMLLAVSSISILMAYALGLTSKDAIEVAGSIKVLFFPLILSIYVHVSWPDFWYFVSWSPFYWAYKGIEEIVYGVALWSDIALYTIIILLITFVVQLFLSKKIKSGLTI